MDADKYCFLSDVKFMEHEEGALRTFSGVAYSGGIITGHAWWDAVVFDLATTESAPTMPLLRDHKTSEIAGTVSSISIADTVEVSGVISTTTHGKEIATLSDEGFPWQMSVRISPARIEELLAGETARVNGQTVTGPIHIFRDSKIKEVSFVALGADDTTEAKVFTRQTEKEPTMDKTSESQKGEPVMVTAEQFAAQAAELALLKEQNKEFADKIKADSQAKRTADAKGLFAAAGVTADDSLDSLTAEQFAAVAKLVIAKPAKKEHDKDLFTDTVTDGSGEKANTSTDGFFEDGE